MNYEKIYNQIIERAKTRVLEGYKENHHVIPRCMGGADDKDNLVALTAREHYICHKLLVEIYPSNDKLIFGLWRMTQTGNASRYVINSKEYEYNRILFSNAIKLKLTGKKVIMTKARLAAIESRRGKPGRVLSDEAKKKISESLKGYGKGIPKPPRTAQHCEKLSKSNKGQIPWNKGIKKVNRIN
jgi:hypothetical protein